MIVWEQSLNTIIPSNKFYPPRIDDSHFLLRTGLLTAKLPRDAMTPKIILIEAQAGQGKTTLACQFLNHFHHDFIWYQIGPEDSDPVFLLVALLADLTLKFPDFRSPQLRSILAHGNVGPLDIRKCATLFLKDLDSYLTTDIVIAFDDLHLLPAKGLTNEFLEYLLDASPPKLHFLLISRRPLHLQSKTLRNGVNVSYLSTADLALNATEIEDLFNNSLNETINRQDALEIERITGGWIMGIVLASHPVTGRGRFWNQTPPRNSLAIRHGNMLEYFQDEIFDQIPDFLHTPFLKLSLISEIPVDLAVRITGIQDIEGSLTGMGHENFFVYRLDDNHTVFRFHHLFREFLELRAIAAFTSSEIKEIQTCEAEYYLQKSMLEKALACYRNAEDYKTMNALLRSHGMQLFEKNRTLTILSLLQDIPEDILFQHSWLTLYTGLMRIDFSPRGTLRFFDAARTRFIAEGDETGEIIALSQTIAYHLVTSSLHNLGRGVLQPLEDLFIKNQPSLPLHVRIMAARNLGAVFGFFVSDLERGRKYALLANRWATDHDMKVFIASTRFVLGCIDLLCGNFALFPQEAEKAAALINDPLVGMYITLILRVMHLFSLSLTGDFPNFFRQQQALRDCIDQKVLTQTVALPYLIIWSCTCHISKGELEEGLDFLRQGFDLSSTVRTEHIQSQLLQWQAYIFSIRGDIRRARSLIQESIQLRAIAGSPFHTAFQFIVAGAVYTRTGDRQHAAACLQEGIKSAISVPCPYLEACGLLHRSYLHLLSSEHLSAREDLKAGLCLMKKNGYGYFWTWEPEMMTRLLSESVSADIEKEFSLALARKRLGITFSGSGEIIPLLQITLLDTFRITEGKRQLFSLDDFTVSQQQILGLIVTAPDQKISQEKAQVFFWPDDPPAKAKKKFDALMVRLRKKFSEHISAPVQNYIILSKGFLCLRNVEIDVLSVMDACTAARTHSRKNEWWQAGNAFYRAYSLWKRKLPTDIFINDYASSQGIALLSAFAEACLTQADHLAGTGQTEDAIEILESLLLSQALEEKAVIHLCTLYFRNNMPLKARKVLNSYGKALKQIDCTTTEIKGILAEILAQSSKSPD